MELRKNVGHRTLLMPCAGAIIGDGKGNVLPQLRADDNTWPTHGGSIEQDERVEDAMIREIQDENWVKSFRIQTAKYLFWSCTSKYLSEW